MIKAMVEIQLKAIQNVFLDAVISTGRSQMTNAFTEEYLTFMIPVGSSNICYDNIQNFKALTFNLFINLSLGCGDGF
jgi:hypothetical protein